LTPTGSCHQDLFSVVQAAIDPAMIDVMKLFPLSRFRRCPISVVPDSGSACQKGHCHVTIAGVMESVRSAAVC
jgi:hypothetical protein